MQNQIQKSEDGYQNIRFDSKLEGMIYLKILEFAKKYPKFERQPKYVLSTDLASAKKFRRTIYKGDLTSSKGKIYTIDVKDLKRKYLA